MSDDRYKAALERIGPVVDAVRRGALDVTALDAVAERISLALAPSEAEQAAECVECGGELEDCGGHGCPQAAEFDSYGPHTGGLSAAPGQPSRIAHNHDARGDYANCPACEVAAEAAGPEPGLAAPSVADYPGLLEDGPPNPENPELDGDE